MTNKLISGIADLVWPTLDGNPGEHENREREKLAEETRLIAETASKLGSDMDELKGHLGTSEKLLESESSRKAGIESRLLNMAGLVSIAGTVVLGALFSLAAEKLIFSAPLARTVLSVGCLYLALQLVAALHASVRGLQATGYPEDQPHELLPRHGVKTSVYLRQRVEHVLVRVAEHRQINNGKLDQLKIAHTAMRNFLWGLLLVATAACVLSSVWPPSTEAIQNPTSSAGPPPQVPGVLTGTDFGQPVLLISAGMCLTALGVVLLAIGGSTARRLVGAAMAAVGLGATFLGNAKFDTTVFKVDRLIGELRLELSVGEKGKPRHAFIRRLVTVGPFPDGNHVLVQDDVMKCVSSALEQYEGMPIGGWEVVGRVDKRQLRPERAVVYGSNQALAMARASWVAQNVLTSQASFDLTHAVVSVGGAREVGASVGADDLQSDRAVDVFAVVNASISDKGTANLPKPVVCPRPLVSR